jgi:hypothetical protein
MSVVVLSPYSLIQGDIAKVRVRAQNGLGFGDYSDVNSAGADVRVAPVSINLPERGSETSTT